MNVNDSIIPIISMIFVLMKTDKRIIWHIAYCHDYSSEMN